MARKTEFCKSCQLISRKVSSRFPHSYKVHVACRGWNARQKKWIIKVSCHMFENKACTWKFLSHSPSSPASRHPSLFPARPSIGVHGQWDRHWYNNGDTRVAVPGNAHLLLFLPAETPQTALRRIHLLQLLPAKIPQNALTQPEKDRCSILNALLIKCQSR